MGTTYDGMGNSLKNQATYNAAGCLESIIEAPNLDTLTLHYNGMGELARTVLTHLEACSLTTLGTDDFVFAPDGRALYLRTFNTVAVSVDYVWLDNLPVAQFQDSYDTLTCSAIFGPADPVIERAAFPSHAPPMPLPLTTCGNCVSYPVHWGCEQRLDTSRRRLRLVCE